MGFVSEFKDFAVKGNVIDLAVGVIIGGAFGKIVSSVVDDLIMPIVGQVTGKVDFKNLYIPLDQKVKDAIEAKGSLSLEDAKKAGAVIAYGNFIGNIITFLIVAFVIFIMVKAINKAKKEPAPAPAAPPEPTKEEVLLGEIRDLLKAGR